MENIFTEAEWEALCDQCGVCCLYKIEDADTHEILYTRIVCPLLDKSSKRCVDYAKRFEKMPTCVKLSPEGLKQSTAWLPMHCAYRCIYEGRQLPEWHPIFADERPEAETIRGKLAIICREKGPTLPTQEKLKALMESSFPPDKNKSLDRQLIRNVVE